MSLPARIPSPQSVQGLKNQEPTPPAANFCRDSPIAVPYSIPAVLWQVGLRTGTLSGRYLRGQNLCSRRAMFSPTPLSHPSSGAGGLLGPAHLILRQGGERFEVVEVQVLAIFLVEAPGGWVHGLHLGAQQGLRAGWNSSPGPRSGLGSPPQQVSSGSDPLSGGSFLRQISSKLATASVPAGLSWAPPATRAWPPWQRARRLPQCRQTVARGRLGRGRGWHPEGRGHWRARADFGLRRCLRLRQPPGCTLRLPALSVTVRGGATPRRGCPGVLHPPGHTEGSRVEPTYTTPGPGLCQLPSHLVQGRGCCRHFQWQLQVLGSWAPSSFPLAGARNGQGVRCSPQAQQRTRWISQTWQRSGMDSLPHECFSF